MKFIKASGQTAGLVASMAAYLLWGTLPIYWKLINHVPATEILAHRIVWCFLFMVLFIVATRRTSYFITEVRHLLADKKRIFNLFICAFLISVNWLTYIWAVNDNRIIETSFGYYINPLVSVLLGIIVLHERLAFWPAVSFVCATIGVAATILHAGTVPWVSLVLAVSFGLYGLYKKIVKLSAVTSITLETIIVLPVAMGYLLHLASLGENSLNFDTLLVSGLLIGAGAVTAIPLVLFSYGASKLPLTIVGLTQYFSPTMSLLIGIFLYHETFTAIHMVSFSFIWLALIIFSLAQTPPFTTAEKRLGAYWSKIRRDRLTKAAKTL